MASAQPDHAVRPRTYRVPEVARILGLGRTATYDAIRRGDLPALRVGGRVLVPRVAIERLLGEDDGERATG